MNNIIIRNENYKKETQILLKETKKDGTTYSLVRKDNGIMQVLL